MIKKCVKCGKEKEHHAKGMCYGCYRNLAWEPKKGICKRCGREMMIHAKGLCRGCYNFTFQLDKVKAYNYRKWYNIDLETYKKIIEKCVICGFDKVVDLHHLDGDKKNNSEKNLIGLCPNHHKMLHDFRYREEMFNILKEKGYSTPKDIKLEFRK
jgi:ribosomal protein L37E